MTKDKSDEIYNHPLQSKEWEEFRKAWGNQATKVDGNLLTIHPLPIIGAKIAIFEKGAILTQQLLDSLKNFAKENNIILIRMEPNIKKKDQLIKLLIENGAQKGKTIFTPTTFWFDLTKSEDEMLTSFHPKTRYNIRYAKKNGVEIAEDNSDKAFEKYIELTRETVKRQGFYAHSEKYHRLMWEYLHTRQIKKNKRPIAHLLAAKYKGEIITTWILFVWKNFLYYPYGASSEKYKNVMANNLMMWEAIKFGKKMGLSTFDLWGREEGKGFTKFKEGYNPEVIEFLGTWDLVINKPIYVLYQLLEKVRWLILRVRSRFIKPQF